VNLKTFGGGMMMYKRQSVRRKNATNVYIRTGVMKTYRSTKKSEKRKERCERSKGSGIRGAVSETKYERERK
jgi:hypothetical protein